MSAADRHVGLFNDSLERCRQDPRFFERFYDAFSSASTEVAAMFASTDMRHQRRSMEASLYMVVLASQGDDAAEVYLSQIAKRHGRSELNIHPGLYDLWEACLIETARAVDPYFTPEVEASWRHILSFGVQYMKARY